MRILLNTFLLLVYSNTLQASSIYSADLLIEESKTSTIHEILVRDDFTVLDKNSVFSPFTTDTYWLKIVPKSTFYNSQSILFCNGFNHYESIYFIYSKDSIVQKSFGSNQLFESATYVPSFELNDKIKALYIQIRSDTFLFESFKIDSDNDINLEITKYLLIQMFFFVFILLVLGYILVLYLKTKQPILKKYLVYLISSSFMFAFISNLGRYFFWENLPFSASYLEIGFTFAMVWTYSKFCIRMTEVDKTNPGLKKALSLFLWVALIVIFLTAIFLRSRHLSLLANLIPPIAIIFLLTFATIGFLKKKKKAGIYLLGMISFVAGSVLRLLINWGVIEYSLTADLLVYLGVIIELILFTYAVMHNLDKKIKSSLDEKDKEVMELQKHIEKLNYKKSIKSPLTKELLAALINEEILTPLTTRESEVLFEILKKGSQKEIAERLFVSLSTLKTHLGRIYIKMGTKNRIETIDKVRTLLTKRDVTL
ncbi:MAG: 7TM diverse intracellular signaling domain-containing protein [Putridiphycobacter sp.]